MTFPEPSEQNNFLAEHISLLRKNFHHYVGRSLVDPALTAVEAAKTIYHAPFVVVSHDTASSPIFNYGNQTALALFEMTWPEFTALPSRQSAEPPNQAERSRLLAEVSSRGFFENYRGIRVSKGGRRFWIEQVTVWNLRDSQGGYRGQAAVYSQWRYIDDLSLD